MRGIATPKEWKRLEEKGEMILSSHTRCQFVGFCRWQAEIFGDRFSQRYFLKQPAGLSQKPPQMMKSLDSCVLRRSTNNDAFQ
jgi:hypothetical protein